MSNLIPFHSKSLGDFRDMGIYLTIIKAILQKLTVNIKLDGEILRAILLKSGTRQGYPQSPYLINIVFEVLAGELG